MCLSLLIPVRYFNSVPFAFLHDQRYHKIATARGGIKKKNNIVIAAAYCKMENKAIFQSISFP